MDLILFKRRNRDSITLKGLYLSSVLFLFGFFFIAGNFFRIFSLYFLKSSLSALEIFFYLVTVPLYFSRLRKSQYVLLAIGISTFYGYIKYGWDAASILYSCKLFAMIISGIAVGEALFIKYTNDPNKGLFFLLYLFAINMIVGWIIFFCFPNSKLFFIFLQKFGIHFYGDPHQNRFISTFFDPNYYSAIACIPFMLSLLLRKYFFAISFFISILFTWSRSGVATFFLLLFFLFILEKMFTQKRVDARRRIKTFVYLGIFLVSILIFSEELVLFFSRLFSLANDNSALCRLHSFVMGCEYFLHYPFFGWGYDYLAKFLLEDKGITGIDSSLLFTLINFGLIPTLTFIFISIYESYNYFNIMFVISNKNNLLASCFFWFYAYVLIIVIFTCQFNHIIYYQYWLIPIIVLFTFLDKWRKIYSFI